MASYIELAQDKASGVLQQRFARHLQEMAAKNNLKRITLELDSKNSTVVLDDANLEKVFLCVEAIAENAGHMGFAASKVYV